MIFTDLDRPRTSGFPPSLLAYRLGTCRRLAEVLVRHRIEVVQSHLPQANFLALWIACRRLARVYPTVHNNREFDYGQRTRLKLAARRQAYRLLLRCCDGMVAVSEQVGRSLARGCVFAATGSSRSPMASFFRTKTMWADAKHTGKPGASIPTRC